MMSEKGNTFQDYANKLFVLIFKQLKMLNFEC